MSFSVPIFDDLIQSPRPYNPTHFVDREIELRIVAEKVRQAQPGDTLFQPIVNFWGVRGIGKTWLMQHLRHLYAYAPTSDTTSRLKRPSFTLLYTFPADATAITLETCVRELAAQAHDQLASVVAPEVRDTLKRAQSAGDVKVLISALLRLTHDFVPLLLLDNAEKAQQMIWAQLEQHLIEPLVSNAGVLVVMAGRRQVPRWRRFEVRRRAMGADASRVHPFDRSAVGKQIAQREYQVAADLLFPYTAGNPHLVDAIGQHLMAWSAGQHIIDQSWLDQHQSALLQIVRTSEEQLLEDVPAELRSIIYAIAPLRFYRLEALRFMLTEQHIEVEERPDGYYLSIVRELDQATEIVWWDRQSRAYVTSEVVRQLVNRRQLLEDRHAYAAHHRQASQMYWGWVRQYAKASEDFIGEILFHLASLDRAGRDDRHLLSEIQEVLHFVRQHLSADHLLGLRNQIEGDQELLDLLPADVHVELIQQLDQLLHDKVQ